MARTGIRLSAVIIDGDKILLIHRKKNGEEYWVFPGGGEEDTDESQKKGIMREVKEETNLDVTSCELDFLAFNEASNKDEPFFKCQVKKGGTLEIIGEERDRQSQDNWYRLEWVKINKLKDIWLVPEKAKEEVIKRYS